MENSIIFFFFKPSLPLSLRISDFIQPQLRVEKKQSAWPFVHTQVESQILLLRKGRLAQFADEAYLMLDATSPIVINT